METLSLIHGDLVIDGAGGYVMLTGINRIRQDLSLALLEEYGTDRFHPRWGSIIKQYLGSAITPELQQLVKAEVNRVIQNYIALQQAEVIRSTTFDIEGQFDTSDVVRSLDGIDVRTTLDAIYLAATVTTLSRESVTISRQIGN